MSTTPTNHVFPAPAGINRCPGDGDVPVSGVPRASGDKPGWRLCECRKRPCSPRQRG
ncbi:hypothetical protein CIT292_09837 [Citrobacter youngae ATCC 29220]|uniref:Uncharacterized protein n=1 Tax=Citrobacter youngae ATCC 29220 TaxID=500640 RepID=D4BH30_9ENTR|nr:hypothetical protein CIT292_09837 [Citrobacter youngae ATCC 29220]